jgi:predicted nucleic acid-binding protein
VAYKQEIYIQDACILFDLVDLKLGGMFFRLISRAITTPHVIGEITDPGQHDAIMQYVRTQQLVIDGSGLIEDIRTLSNQFPGLSIPDCSVLELAMRRKAIVCSSDGALRKIANKHELTVRGIIWIIDSLQRAQIITAAEALKKLAEYKEINIRAPWRDIERLVDDLKSKL